MFTTSDRVEKASTSFHEVFKSQSAETEGSQKGVQKWARGQVGRNQNLRASKQESVLRSSEYPQHSSRRIEASIAGSQRTTSCIADLQKHVAGTIDMSKISAVADS